MTLFETPRTIGWGIALIRIMVGIVFVMHGGQKLFIYGVSGVASSMEQMGMPLPMVSAVLASFAEFFGGAFMLLGLFTRIAAIPLAFVMFVAVTTVHISQGFFLPGGFEYALTLLITNIGLILTGAGELSLDHYIAHRRVLRHA